MAVRGEDGRTYGWKIAVSSPQEKPAVTGRPLTLEMPKKRPLCGPDAGWVTGPLPPDLWMHQLGGVTNGPRLDRG